MIITNQTLEDAQDLELAKSVGEILHDHYPNWLWAVEVHDHGPFIRLINAPIQGYGYYVNPKDLLTPTTLKKQIINAGGEMLERSGCTRGRIGEEEALNMKINHVEGVESHLYTIPKSMRG